MKGLPVYAYVFFTSLIFSCQPTLKVSPGNFHFETPPNGILIGENLYCDRTEMDNSGWREYMFWNKKIFGPTSQEYISTLPDTSVWLQVENCLHVYAAKYLREPSYLQYPVVGISKKQAEAYSIWRSDRVFEFLLNKYEIVQYDTAQTKENYFTTERYFKGRLKNVKPDTSLFYPAFKLPTLYERALILSYADSVDNAYFENCNSIYCKDCKVNYPNMWSDIEPCVNQSITVDPTMNVKINCSSKSGNPIYNVRGNVREWVSAPDTAVGGGWRDKRSKILSEDIFQTAAPNAWTGFRNVCEWKKWGE